MWSIDANPSPLLRQAPASPTAGGSAELTPLPIAAPTLGAASSLQSLQPPQPPPQPPPPQQQLPLLQSLLQPLQPHPQQKLTTALENTEVGLFWDYENLSVARSHDAAEISNRLRALSLRFGRLVERRVYHDPSKLVSSVAPNDRSRLDSAGFTLVDCPTRNEKETVDKKIIVDVMHFAITRISRAQAVCVVLMTNDGDYAYMLSRLRDLQVKVVVVYLAGHAADALLHACDHAFSWRADVLMVGEGVSEGGSPEPLAATAAHAAATNSSVKASARAKRLESGQSGGAKAEKQRLRRRAERQVAGAIRKAPRQARGQLLAGAAPQKAPKGTRPRQKPGREWTDGIDEWAGSRWARLDEPRGGGRACAWADEPGQLGLGQRQAAKAEQKKKGKKLRRQLSEREAESNGGWGGCGAGVSGGWPEMDARPDASPWALRQELKKAAKAAKNAIKAGKGKPRKLTRAKGKTGGVKKKLSRKGGKGKMKKAR